MLTLPLLVSMGMFGVALAEPLTIWVPDFHYFPQEFVAKLQGAIVNANDHATTVTFQCSNTADLSDEDHENCLRLNTQTVTFDRSLLRLSTSYGGIPPGDYESSYTTVCHMDPPGADCTLTWSESFEGLKPTSSAYKQYFKDTAKDPLYTIYATPTTAISTQATTTDGVDLGASTTPSATTTDIASITHDAGSATISTTPSLTEVSNTTASSSSATAVATEVVTTNAASPVDRFVCIGGIIVAVSVAVLLM